MKTSTINSSLWALVSIVGAATFAPSCGDGDPTTNPDTGKGGSGNRGGSAGRGGSTGGSVTGGDAGTSGSAGQGGTAGGGRGGTSGTSGTAGASGMGGEGGEAGAMGGEGGEGGMTTVTLYDFESGVQGWGTTTAGASVAQSTDQHVDGANALKVTHAVIDNSSLLVSVNGPPVWPGTVLTFHAFLPAGLDTTGGTYFQTFAQADNYKIGFDTAGNSSRTAVPGGWTTWTYTMPNTFPGGLQVLGFQLGDNSGGGTIAAGNIYLDAVTATGGVANCAIATPAGLHDFETALPTNPPVYVVDGAQTTIAQATDRAFAGTGSLKVSFANLPAPTGADPTKRIIYIDKPNVYCGQTMTFHVFLPTGSDGLTFQLYAQYDNFGTFTGTGPQTVIRNAWNTATYTIPTTVGPGGIQRVGMEFMYSGTAPLTGDAWVDAITW